MGIIIKQSFRNLITTYFGFGIGAINTLFLFTYFLKQEYYGLISFLLSAANLIWPFLAFGVHSTLIKFFTFYKTKEERDRLMNLVLLLPLVVSIILGIIGIFSYDYLLHYFAEGNELVQPYIWLIFVIAFSTAYFEIFFSWSKIYYKSVLGNFMKEVLHRLCISLLLFAVYLSWISVNQFIYSVAIVFVLRCLWMALYAFSLYLPKIDFKFPNEFSRVLKYTALILVAASVATVLLDLDKVMIEYFMPIENVAIYGIGIYIATVISVPQKAMHQITHPLTADYLNTKNKKSLASLYKKSSVNLLLISGLIFVLILTNLHELYELIPNQYRLSVLVVLLISLAKLYDNVLGNNNSILFNSDYYRLVLAVGVGLVIMAFLLNLLFIPKFGMEGAAFASFLAFSIYNTAKIYLVFSKFKMHPFNKNTIWVLGLLLLFTLGFYFWEFPFYPLINIALKAGCTVCLYTVVIYFFKFSEELNKLADVYLQKLK